VGLGVFLVAVTMLFVAFTASYLARRTAADWAPVPLPELFWVNTAVLVASSAALEWGRRRGRRGDLAALRTGVRATAALGALFVLGQVGAWRQLAAQGVFMATSPHSAFVYLLSGVHAVHLTGGVGALAYALRQVDRHPDPPGAVEAPALYWHFVDALWLYVFAVLAFL